MSGSAGFGDGSKKDSHLETTIRLRNTRINLISWAAGSIDAFSYLGLGHVFTANMTGNTILLALALSGDQVDGLSAIRSGIALGSYFLGAVLGTIIVSFKIQNRKEDLRRKAKGESEIKALEEAFEKEQWPPEVNVAILIEGLILLLFGLLWSTLIFSSSPFWMYALIFLSAIAMGIQSVAISHLGIWGVVTTYITGTYTSFFVGLVTKISGKSESSASMIRQASSATGQEQSPIAGAGSRSLPLEASALIFYALGAFFSGLIFLRSESAAPWISIIAVFVVALISKFLP